MLKDVAEHMTSVTGFIQMALVLFFSVFISVLIREALRSKREVQHMSALPLADENDPRGDA
jgi:hypothetical protein